MNFEDVLLRAKACDEAAIHTILEMYKPRLLKESIINGVFDEDLFQELCITVLRCIDLFDMQHKAEGSMDRHWCRGDIYN